MAAVPATLIQLSSSAAVIAHTGIMTSEQPISDRDGARGASAPDLSQTADGSSPEECAAYRLAAVIMAIESALLARIASTSERLKRTQAIMSATTEMIATSHEALARSRDLLDGRRHEQVSKDPTFATPGSLGHGAFYPHVMDRRVPSFSEVRKVRE
jgi:hypothetical protein